MYGRFGLGGLLPLCLQLVVGLVCLKGCGGKLLFFHHATSAATVVILAVTSCSTVWLSMGSTGLSRFSFRTGQGGVRAARRMEPFAGLEPAASGFGDRRSSNMS